MLSIRIPANPRFGKNVREAVTSFAHRFHVSEADLEEFIFALGEATANAIEHSKCSGCVEVHCQVENDTILASVRDSGEGFTAESLTDLPLPEGLTERGRGLPIMRRCTDILAVHSQPGKGTSVVLGRYLHSANRHDQGALAS